MASFRITVFDPLLIVMQICILQFSFWFTLAVVMILPYSISQSFLVDTPSPLNTILFGIQFPSHFDFFLSWKRDGSITEDTDLLLANAGNMGWLPTAQGFLVLIAAATHAFLFARIFFSRFVRRAKLVLDFASTLLAFHLVFCFIASHSRLPESFALITTLIQWLLLVHYGQSVCMEIELQPIMVNNNGGNSNSSNGEEFELLQL